MEGVITGASFSGIRFTVRLPEAEYPSVVALSRPYTTHAAYGLRIPAPQFGIRRDIQYAFIYGYGRVVMLRFIPGSRERLECVAVHIGCEFCYGDGSLAVVFFDIDAG